MCHRVLLPVFEAVRYPSRASAVKLRYRFGTEVTSCNVTGSTQHRVRIDDFIDPCLASGLTSVIPMSTWKARSPDGWNRRVAIATMIAFVAAVPLLSGMPHSEKHENRRVIDNLEETWRNAALKGNSAAMEGLLADDYMAITPTGVLQSKEQTLALIRNGTLRFKSIDYDDRKVRFYGTTALVTCRADVSGVSADGDMSGSYRYTRVYARDSKGVWRIVSFEANRIREPEPRKSNKPAAKKK